MPKSLANMNTIPTMMTNTAAPAALPIVHYNLACNDRNVFPSSYQPALLGSLQLQQTRSQLVCADQNGIQPHPQNNPRGAALQSQLPMAEFLQRQQDASGITFELWITPTAVTTNEAIPILAIGQEFPYNPYQCDGTDFFLYQEAEQLIVKYVSNRQSTRGGRDCRRARITLRPNQQFQRVALALSHDELHWYINDENVTPDYAPGVLDQLRQWNPEYYLQVFPGTPTFTGSLRALAMYDYPLTTAQAVETYYQGANQLRTADADVVQDLQAQVQLPLIYQNQTGTIHIQANARDFPVAAKVVPMAMIRTLPRHGVLSVHDDNTPLHDEQLVPLTYSADDGTYHLELQYQPYDPYYFTVPYLGHEESFAYQLVALDGYGNPLRSRFLETKQHINILHFHHDTNVTRFDGEAQVPLQPEGGRLSLKGTLRVKYHGSVMVNKARVILTATKGLLEVPEWVEIDQSPSDDCTRCSKKREAKSIAFLAFPEDIQNVLDHVQYKKGSTYNDTITVEVWDGVRSHFGDGECQRIEHIANPYIDANGTLLDVVGDHCHVSILQIPLLASSEESVMNTLHWNKRGEKIDPILTWVMIVFLISFGFNLYFVIDKLRKCLARGTNHVSPEEEDEDDDDIVEMATTTPAPIDWSADVEMGSA
jgi:Concanavalin A-like lectin/glucanases superfamily